ncbi:MAG: AI-2E family transporter [Solobacterium sp.]|nr:AI-2E family transporter [Solobacterium sp.]
MKNRWTEDTRQHIEALTVSGIIIATVCFAFMNWGYIAEFVGKVWKALYPFIWGFCIAFVLSPLRRLCEERWLAKSGMSQKLKRTISVVFSLIVLILCIVLFFYVLIPQLSSSVETLASSMDGYISRLEQLLRRAGQRDELDEFLYSLYDSLKENLIGLVSGPDSVVTKVLSYSVTIVRGVLSFLVGIIIAVYLLLDEERWVRQFRQAVYAFLSTEHAESLFNVIRLTAKMLDNFIFGKALDSFIIGITCAICCGLMKIPYTPLIAFIVGLTNMIPVFGPFIGAIPCAFILMIISPAKALEFIIFILVLQQVDGNILGPYILGDSMGLPPLWIMVAIVVGGALWGVLGMFLGVPLFSVLYVLIRELILKRLKEKRIRVD